MNFKQFLLNEYSKAFSNEVDLVYQQILDNLDDGHVDMNDEKLSFNVGIIIKNSEYNNLFIVIRQGSSNQVRLGTNKENKPTIVVDKKGRLPTRKNIDKFLDDVDFAKDVKKQLKKYLETYYDADSENEASTSYEKKKGFNADVEKHLEKLIKAIDTKIDNFHKGKSYLKDEHGKTANVAKQETLQSAVSKLLDDELGGSFNAFKSIVMKLPEAEFVNHLESEAKKKVLSRLESYYEHKSHQFTAD